MIPNDAAEAITFADVLVPGDDLFPSFSGSGAIDRLTERMHGADDGALLPRLQQAIAACGSSLAALPMAERAALAAKIAAEESELFAAVRKIVYLTYYEQEPVRQAIRALGFAYNDTPLPDGYPPEPFDPATDAPRHGRGRWIPTDQVRRVDLSGLGYAKE